MLVNCCHPEQSRAELLRLKLAATAVAAADGRQACDADGEFCESKFELSHTEHTLQKERTRKGSERKEGKKEKETLDL